METRKYHTNHAIGQIVQFAQDGEYFFNKGIKYYRRRELYKAKKYFERAIQFDSKEPVFLCQLAVVLAELGEFDASNTILLEIVEKLEPEMYECYSFLANNCAYLGLFQEAKKYAKQYLNFAPDGEFNEDIEDLLELLSIETSEFEGLYSHEDELIVKQETARELLENGKLKEASIMLQKLVKEYPEFWSAHNNLSLAHFYLGNVSKAIKIVQDVLKKNEGNLHALCNLAVYYHYLGREKEVAHIVKQLQVVYPIDMDHRSKLGITFALLGQYENSFKWLRWLQKFGYEGDGAFYYWLSVSAYYTDRKQLAVEMWQKVIKFNPEKKGAEPWLKVQSHEHKGNTIYQSLIQQFKETDSEEKKLLILFLLRESGNIKLLEEVNLIVMTNHESDIIKDFTNLMLNKLADKSGKIHLRLTEGLHVIEALSEQCTSSQELEHKFYMLWFRILINALHLPISLKNSHAWSAAIEYCCLKAEDYHITQKEIAEKYTISSSTLRKYIHYVTELV
ncbi:MAG TPA: hypothetical protein GX497_12960 [Bacillus bacterium]|nr:hypothetical protein [Bacillus sp. (in: firmicutes)]